MAGLPGVGLGIYHSGLEMYGREVSFGYADGGLTGVFEVPSKCAAGVMPRTTFKESVLLGYMFRSPFEGVLPADWLQALRAPTACGCEASPHVAATPCCSHTILQPPPCSRPLCHPWLSALPAPSSFTSTK